MHLALITAGGAGMFCGSCMHDNTWARALMERGTEVSLIPTYTPIRVDEHNETNQPVLMGGINLYLNYRYKWWRNLPRALTRWTDSPWFIRTVTRFAVSNNAHDLGALTVAMLEGDEGPEHQPITELVDFIDRLDPDAVCFSNALLAGAVPHLQRQFSGGVFCTLQGDDIFLEDLIPPYKEQALSLLRRLAPRFDGFFVHSAYYRDFMSDYLRVPAERFHLLPLGIDLEGHDGTPQIAERPFTVGYFARICPEKGLHHLIEAFRRLRNTHPEARLRVGGYLGKRDIAYFRDLERNADDLSGAWEYVGSPDRAGKVEFLKSLDVLSVPTDYREPKGIYVLESLANGVPVVQPAHGAFPELLAATEGGLLVAPGDPQDLADRLAELHQNPERRIELGRRGQARVRELFGPTVLAERTLAVLERPRMLNVQQPAVEVT